MTRAPSWLRPGAIAVIVVFLSAASAMTSTNSVPTTKVGSSSFTITADTLKPASCAGITLTLIKTGSGTFSGSGSAELVLGSAEVDTINAGGGNDCVVGGGGNDSLQGGAGTDVCIGGPGTDTFNSNCETQIQ